MSKPVDDHSNVRLQFVKRSNRADVIRPAEDLVQTVPHLLVREVVAAEVVMIVLTIISLLFDAPLEGIANPDHTPNPAKAPWYFLGLQELLHYFPPVVAGVLIPTLVVIALVVIPYFGVNVAPRTIAAFDRRWMTIGVTTATMLICLVMLPFHCWPVIAVTILIWLGMLLGTNGGGRFSQTLGRMSLPGWIMLWFILCTSLLTVIGTLFRGPGWSWVWPWQHGGLP